MERWWGWGARNARGRAPIPDPDPRSAADPAPPPPRPSETFSTPEFDLAVPPGFALASTGPTAGPPVTAEERGRRGRGAAPPSSPLLARFARAADGAELTVVARPASSLKPTLLQLLDIGAWGSPAEVGALVLPRGAVATRPPRALVVPLPPRDSGSVIGVVTPPPLTLYAYEFRLAGSRVALAAAARAGRVFVAAGAAPEAAWDGAGPALTASVESLRVTPLRAAPK